MKTGLTDTLCADDTSCSVEITGFSASTVSGFDTNAEYQLTTIVVFSSAADLATAKTTFQNKISGKASDIKTKVAALTGYTVGDNVPTFGK